MTNKKDLVAKFERIKQYYGTETPTGELRYHIEKAFKKEEKDATFNKTLRNYIYDITKLRKWNQNSQKKQQL
jgi:hypothetical protein